MTHRLSAEEGELCSAPALRSASVSLSVRPQTTWCASWGGRGGAEAGWPGSLSESGGLAPETPEMRGAHSQDPRVLRHSPE